MRQFLNVYMSLIVDMATAVDVVYRILSWIVTAMFLMSSLIKVSPALFPEMNAEMVCF